MKKKRNKFVVLILVICCIIGAYKLYPYVFREKGNLYSLKMSKYYNGFDFDTIILSKLKKGKIKDVWYEECIKESKEVRDYLNKFQLVEIGREEAFKKESEFEKQGLKKDTIREIIFHQSLDMCKHDHDFSRFLKLDFLSDSTLEICSYCDDIMGHKTDSKRRYYKIKDGKIDFEHIYKLLRSVKNVNI
ncbi:hypothetical protein C3495_13640 (plasmid) [Clostridiaceae bacterium 14S0207]|nr:hypothetical protein C3495_13640 [Clostridiaceae bacterium 14S0207]